MTDARAPRAPYGLDLLGPFRLRDAAGTEVPIPQAHHRIVLAALALAGDATVTTEALLAALWDEDPPRSARKTLQGYVARLRRLLGAATIETRPGGYALPPLLWTADVHTARALLDDARGGTQERLRRRAAARDLFRGEPLLDVPSPVLDRLRGEALRDVAARAVEEWAALLVATDPAAAVAPLRQECAVHPHRESLWALLVVALAGSGRRTEALECYRLTRRRLGEDLGVEPGPALRRAQAAALAADGPEPEATAPATADPARVLAGTLERKRSGGAAVALTGGPGAGKTRTARLALPRALFVSVRPAAPGIPGDEAPDRIAHAVLTAWGLGAREADPRAEVLHRWAERPSALGLDDVTRPASYNWLLPVPPGCALVVCTTLPRPGGAGLTAHALPPWSPGRLGALVARARGEGPRPSAVHVREAAALVGGMPAAAYALAARLVADPGLTLAELATELRDPRRRLDALSGQEPDVRGHLDRAYQRLDGPAARALRLLSQLEAGSFPDTVAVAALHLPPAEVRAQLRELHWAGLLESRGTARARRHRIPPLPQCLGREISEYTDPPAMREAAVSRALRAWAAPGARAAAPAHHGPPDATTFSTRYRRQSAAAALIQQEVTP
ncbi:BTAD domain-containing putative transcriptional regulator [Streptomyces sp. NPDC091267]|uniref:BTAD domain-containing putative transcriptional regulator n=1 Tax=Streptomyces sp. NPDC091267 TaxID=3155195 RepID=UPI00342B4ECC